MKKNCFVLSSITNKIIKHEKKKINASFTYFRKCFNMFNRNGI